MLIGAFGIFFSIHGPYVASFYEITFSRRPLREEREIRVEQLIVLLKRTPSPQLISRRLVP